MNGYEPRLYHVVKLCVSSHAVFLVVAEDLDDPDVWAVINRFATARDAWHYVSEVQARNRTLAREVGCRT